MSKEALYNCIVLIIKFTVFYIIWSSIDFSFLIKNFLIKFDVIYKFLENLSVFSLFNLFKLNKEKMKWYKFKRYKSASKNKSYYKFKNQNEKRWRDEAVLHLFSKNIKKNIINFKRVICNKLKPKTKKDINEEGYKMQSINVVKNEIMKYFKNMEEKKIDNMVLEEELTSPVFYNFETNQGYGDAYCELSNEEIELLKSKNKKYEKTCFIITNAEGVCKKLDLEVEADLQTPNLNMVSKKPMNPTFLVPKYTNVTLYATDNEKKRLTSYVTHLLKKYNIKKEIIDEVQKDEVVYSYREYPLESKFINLTYKSYYDVDSLTHEDLNNIEKIIFDSNTFGIFENNWKIKYDEEFYSYQKYKKALDNVKFFEMIKNKTNDGHINFSFKDNHTTIILKAQDDIKSAKFRAALKLFSVHYNYNKTNYKWLNEAAHFMAFIKQQQKK